MKILTFCLLIILAAQTFCRADVTKLPAEDRKALQDVSRFHEIRKVASLPQGIVLLCARDGKMADPGKKWQLTDVIVDDTLPGRRLIWAVTDNDYYVVHYESGGYAHAYHLLIARFKPGDKTPTFVWHGVGGSLKDFSAALNAIAKNQLDDGMP